MVAEVHALDVAITGGVVGKVRLEPGIVITQAPCFACAPGSFGNVVEMILGLVRDRPLMSAGAAVAGSAEAVWRARCAEAGRGVPSQSGTPNATTRATGMLRAMGQIARMASRD